MKTGFGRSSSHLDDWKATEIRETGRKVLRLSSGTRKADKENWRWIKKLKSSGERLQERVGIAEISKQRICSRLE